MKKDAQELYVRADQLNMARRICGRVTGTGSVVLLISIFLMAAACMDIQMRIGRRPDTDVLEKTLRIGESTSTDVVTALGQPYGKGKAMLPIERKPKTMWSYYYEEGSMEDSRRIFLFVFFHKDRYDGYMWFSSLPKQTPE